MNGTNCSSDEGLSCAYFHLKRSCDQRAGGFSEDLFASFAGAGPFSHAFPRLSTVDGTGGLRHPPAPLKFSHLAQRQANYPYSFYKDENTINTVSRELEVIFIRAAEGCAVITRRWHRGPFVFQTPALLLRLQLHLTSFVYLCEKGREFSLSPLLTTSYLYFFFFFFRSRLSPLLI